MTAPAVVRIEAPTITHPSPNHSKRFKAVEAIVAHWTGGTYASAVDWCQRDESDVSYHEIIGPKGELAVLVAPDRGAWAVGCSKAPPRFHFGTSGNSGTYSIALAGGPPTPPTDAQRSVLLERLQWAFAYFGFNPTDTYRIISHTDVAVFPKGHPRAGQYGRKPDPEGQHWLPLAPIRQQLANV